VALKEFLPAAKSDPGLAPLLRLMEARLASRALDAAEVLRDGEDADGDAWALLAPLAPLLEAAVHLCGSSPEGSASHRVHSPSSHARAMSCTTVRCTSALCREP